MSVARDLAKNPGTPLAAVVAGGATYVALRSRKPREGPGIVDKIKGAIGGISFPSFPSASPAVPRVPVAPAPVFDPEPLAPPQVPAAPSWFGDLGDRIKDWTLVGGRVPVPTDGRAAVSIGANVGSAINRASNEAIEGITTGVLGILGGATVKGGTKEEKQAVAAWADRTGATLAHGSGFDYRAPENAVTRDNPTTRFFRSRHPVATAPVPSATTTRLSSYSSTAPAPAPRPSGGGRPIQGPAVDSRPVQGPARSGSNQSFSFAATPSAAPKSLSNTQRGWFR